MSAVRCTLEVRLALERVEKPDANTVTEVAPVGGTLNGEREEDLWSEKVTAWVSVPATTSTGDDTEKARKVERPAATLRERAECEIQRLWALAVPPRAVRVVGSADEKPTPKRVTRVAPVKAKLTRELELRARSS